MNVLISYHYTTAFVICTAKDLYPIVIKLLDQKNQNMTNVHQVQQQVQQL